MKFISWNVNGLRACDGKGFREAFAQLDADFFCLQETPVARRKHRMTGRRGVLAGILLFWAVISLTGVSRFIYSNF